MTRPECINASIGSIEQANLPTERLDRLFERAWPELAGKLDAVGAFDHDPIGRGSLDVIVDLLEKMDALTTHLTAYGDCLVLISEIMSTQTLKVVAAKGNPLQQHQTLRSFASLLTPERLKLRRIVGLYGEQLQTIRQDMAELLKLDQEPQKNSLEQIDDLLNAIPVVRASLLYLRNSTSPVIEMMQSSPHVVREFTTVWKKLSEDLGTMTSHIDLTLSWFDESEGMAKRLRESWASGDERI